MIKKHMSRLNIFLLVAVIALLAGLSAIILLSGNVLEKPYYAVYTSVGEMYFGQIIRFPSFHLSDVYFLQTDSQNTQTPYSIQRFSGAFWGPDKNLYLNPKNIVWKVKLNSDSKVLDFIKNPEGQQAENSLSGESNAEQSIGKEVSDILLPSGTE